MPAKSAIIAGETGNKCRKNRQELPEKGARIAGKTGKNCRKKGQELPEYEKQSENRHFVSGYRTQTISTKVIDVHSIT